MEPFRPEQRQTVPPPKTECLSLQREKGWLELMPV